MAAAAFDESDLRLSHPTDGTQHDKDRAHNRRIVDRWLRGAVSEFPAEFEGPGVIAVPEAVRDERYGPSTDLVDVHLSIGPMSMPLTSQEALDLATALTEAALFYREKKADALAHYEAITRDAQAGVA
jgi:hypothetical protein